LFIYLVPALSANSLWERQDLGPCSIPGLRCDYDYKIIKISKVVNYDYKIIKISKVVNYDYKIV